jgi:ATP-binding cassette subfamily B protein
MELQQMFEKIKWFWDYYKKYPYVLMVLLILTPIQAVFQVSIPRLIEFTVDYVKSGQVTDQAAIILNDFGQNLGLDTVMVFTLSIVLTGIIASILYAYVQGHRAWMNIKLEWLFRQHAFDDITTKGPDFFNRFRTGDLVTRMTDDVAEKLSWFACSGIFRLYEALLMVIFGLIMMVMIDPWLTLFSAGPLPILIVIFFKSATILDKRYDRLQKRISILNDTMESCFYGIRVIKAYVKEKAQKKSFDKAVFNRKDAEISSIKATTVVDSLYQYIWQFGIILVILIGGYIAINGQLSMGKLIAFVYYIVWLIFPMFDIGQFLVKSRQSAVSIDRLLELKRMPAMVTDNGDIKIDGKLRGELVFENVNFAFPGQGKNIIDNVSLSIRPGSTVALVGRVGSGKSWLVNMLPRLVEPTGGHIKLDGLDLKRYKLEDLRRVIGYVPQEPALFSDTVRNNIIFGRGEISESLLEWAVEVSQLKAEIDTFPHGLDTPIGTRGMAISGGQKQRLALARALVGKPKILILDDCTSALDSRTETALWERLHEVMPDMTAILITHRPDTLETADIIYVMDEGKITESGQHTELIMAESLYARIYRRFQLEAAVTGTA